MAWNQTCEAKKDLIPCASVFMSMYVYSNPTYKQYINVVIHQYMHIYLFSLGLGVKTQNLYAPIYYKY